jgi:large subunit ribosomal protein L22
MIARAEAKYIKISPFKARLTTRLLKGMPAQKALMVLENINQKAAHLIKKVLKSAVSNAKNKGYEEDKLFITKVVANPGPVLKRYRAATFGRATTIRKRTSHLIVELDTSEKIIEKTKTK